MGQIIHCGGGSLPEAPIETVETDGKRALVLGGGGIAGAAFEIGALLALNDVFTDFKVTDFDMFVGTSAGAFMSACLVNGISPEEIARSHLGGSADGLPAIRKHEILKPVPGRIRSSSAAWAGALGKTARRMVRTKGQPSLVDTFFHLTEGLASWRLYTTKGLEEYLAKVFSSHHRTNRFDRLTKQLFITATDIDTAQRVVFGEDGHKATISEAVSASAAIPIIYEPVHIKGREYLDGGLRSATNLDIAVAHGASFLVLVNPLVPYLHDTRYLLRGFESPIHHVSQGGLGRLVAQVFRIMAQAQLDKEIELIRLNHPEVDLLVLEPHRDDEHLFVFNLMDYEAREQMAKASFESVAVDLVTHFPSIKQLFGRAGLKLSKGRLVEQLQLVLSGGTADALLQSSAEESA